MIRNIDEPYFSIVIGVYNRETCIKRCVDSCLNQVFLDFEIIVVDDGSSDNTANVLKRIPDSRLKVIEYPVNRGISPSRNTGIKHAKGKWLVGLDSDWELFPTSLQRLFDLTHSLDESIIAVRARQIWDTGRIAPSFIPKEPIDYVGRIKWVDIEGGSDVLSCYRRKIFKKVIFEPNRRGTLEYLYNLNMAQQGMMLYVEDVLCKQYSDAPNSSTRGNIESRMNNFKKSAFDMVWMYQETFRLHGNALRKFGPNQYLDLHKKIALQYFYIGKRRRGIKYILYYLYKRPFDIISWISLFLGLIGPEATLYGNAIWHSIRTYYRDYRPSPLS